MTSPALSPAKKPRKPLYESSQSYRGWLLYPLGGESGYLVHMLTDLEENHAIQGDPEFRTIDEAIAAGKQEIDAWLSS